MLLNDGEQFRIHHGDCIPHMLGRMPAKSVDFSIFSPPFPSLYAYTDNEADIGNVATMDHDAKLHLSFFFRGLMRVLKPGRVAVCHVMQIPRMKRSGEYGLHDFRGTCIRIAERAGLIFEYDWLVRKNPQAQAIRTRSRELQFAGLESDRAKQRGTLGDYLLKFRAPGENEIPIDAEGQVSRNDWIQWAEACWDDIIETDTLNVEEGRGEKDTKHICVARGSLVLTYEGHKPIEEVSVGDLVLTHTGRWMPVTGKRCNGVQPVIQTEAQGVPNLITTPDHKFWVRRGVGSGRWGMPGGVSHPRKRAVENDPEWIPACETKGSYVNQKLPPAQESQYTAEEWWLIGRWLGDGHIDTRGGVHITCARNEETEMVSALGDRAGFVADTGTALQVRIKDRDGRIRSLLKKCGRGCSGKRLPGEALELNQELSEALLSGYLSADGHYVEKYDRWTASSVSRPLLLGMSMVAQRSRGVAASVYAGRPPGECTIEGRTMTTLQEWVISIPPKNLSGIMLPDGAWKKVRHVDSVGDAEVWDLRVAEDESFTVEGCIVHNCPLQLEPIRRCILLYSNPGEIVFSPFTGIGSEGFMAIGGKSPKTGRRVADPRRFYGCELKDEYYESAVRKLKSVKAIQEVAPTFSFEDAAT